MESELLKIFNDEREQVGTAARSEIHKRGLWHETFHCWLIGSLKEEPSIYMQIRSEQKKDYKGLLDITAAGHLLANETPADGLREVHEELGLSIGLDECISLGVLENVIVNPDFIDRELSHVYLYPFHGDNSSFRLQYEEVAGIIKAPFQAFKDLWEYNVDSIQAEGFIQLEDCSQSSIVLTIQREDFVQHQASYYEAFIEQTAAYLQQNT
ncbi:NUDIX hydrolase [Bacillus sp. 1P06AnD]|uniref:NUDIX hydrolase n=1 Tax=Bacillus sp. 1P06AnD TaxID=3132208 RepID=UPI00399F4FD7